MDMKRWIAVWAVGALGLGGGCSRLDQRPLNASAGALERGEYDQAIILANEALEERPKGRMAAEALYIRGRAYEQHPVGSQQQLQANLQAARGSYVEALKLDPPSPLGTYIRASLGKVALYQDDFETASQQLAAAYPALKDAELKAATLYHLGKAQQRSGAFVAADQTLLAVIQRYRDSEWADKANETRGSRGFYVQLAVYSSAAQADAASQVVRSRGMEPKRFLDHKGRQLLRTGPYVSYGEAKQNRERMIDIYKDATIVP